MEEITNAPEQERDAASYKSGFSLAYSLCRVAPHAINDLAAVESSAPIIKGLKAGKEAFEREERQLQSAHDENWVAPDPVKNSFNDKSITVDNRHDVEPER
jgi:hypothetical protein